MPSADLNPDSVYELVIFGVEDGQAVRHVIHLAGVTALQPVTPGVDTIQAMLEDFMGEWQANVLPLLVSAYEVIAASLTEIRTRLGAPPNATIQYGDFWTEAFGGAAWKGANATDGLPTYGAVNVRKLILKRGRRYRGSMRIGGVPEVSTLLNELTTAVYPMWVSAFETLFTSGSVVGGTFIFNVGVFPKVTYLKAPGPTVFPRNYWTEVSAPVVQKILTTQNSRKRRRVLGA